MLDIGIYRSTTNKWVFGVCGGIGEKFNVDAKWVRLGVVLIAILPAGLGTFAVALIYLALTVLLPKNSSTPSSQSQ